MRSGFVVGAIAMAVGWSGCGGGPPGRVLVAAPLGAGASTAGPAVAPVAGPTVAPTPPGLRLPDDVRPTRGELELTIVPAAAALDGVARYQVAVARPTAVVWLNAVGLEVASATIDGQVAQVIPGGDQAIGVMAAAPLATGVATVEVRFRAPIARDRSVGVYAEREGDAWYAYTFFEAIDARRAFPCFDEPAFKIPWTLRLRVRAEHVALGNAAVVAETPEPGGMKLVTMAETRPLPSYLVAFVVGPFELVAGGVAGRAQTPVRFVVPAGRAAETRYAREVTPKVVAALEDYFDMAYPYGKLDVAVVPRYWGTMEHPGLVAMGQPLTLIPPARETRDRKRSYANILAHELAHYWFGDLVTMAWWDDTWLNEGLGTWLDAKITDAVEPGWRFLDDGVGNVEEALDADALPAARAMRQVVDSADGIQASFDNATTYAKGAAVFAMFERWLGPERWREIIRAHVRAHADGSATADDFLATVATRVDPTAAAALGSFLAQPGAPLVTMDVRCVDGAARLALAQRRLLPVGLPDPDARRWQIPVCVRSGVGRGPGVETCVVLADAAAEVALPGPCPTWLAPHVDGHGYYRATVTGASLPPATQLTRRERLRAIGELGSARSRGDVPVAAAIGAGLQLVADRDARVARWGISLTAVRRSLLDDDLDARYLRLLDRAFGKRARALGWQRRAGDDDDVQALRQALVPLVAERDRRLGAEATTLARAALRDPAAVPDDLLGPVLRVAAARGDRALFDELLAAARATPDRRHRGRLLNALAWFADPALAALARATLTDASFDLREARPIVFVQLSRRPTRAAAWAWLRDALPGLLARMRQDEAAGMIGAVATGVCTPEQRAEAAALLTPLTAGIAGAAHALANGLAEADRCIAEQARELPALRAFLMR